VFTPEMKKGSIELIILAILSREPRHGYEIGKLIELRSRGELQYRISSLYPVLCRMEERGWIKGRWVEKEGQRRRCYYQLTPKGEQALVREQKTWDAFTAAVDRIVRLSHA
jgi:PadR family transcriptional regulator PadR